MLLIALLDGRVRVGLARALVAAAILAAIGARLALSAMRTRMLVSHHGSAMPNVHRLLPRLIVNRLLLQAVIDEPRPCCALGFVEERKAVLPLIALGLPGVEDLHDLGDGFHLGLQGAKARGAEILLLDFVFQGREPLQVALDPANPAVRRVLSAIGKSSAYFVLAVGANGVTAFRADADELQLRPLNGLLWSKPSSEDGRYERHAARGQALPGLPRRRRQSLVWLRSDDASLLELSTRVRHELRPVH